MRHAPLFLRALFGTVLPDADAGEGAGWWSSFRGAAERLEAEGEALVAAAREAVARVELDDEGQVFVSVRASFAHAAQEPAALAPTLALGVRALAGDRSEVEVALFGGASPSAKAMALVQGALVGFAARVAHDACAGVRDDRRCIVEVGAPRTSFVERLVARGLDDDAIALGLDAEKLGLLVDGPRESRARPSAALSMRALETDFKLTPTQARVALRLAEGASLQEAAARLDMSYATARVHLKQIFAKLEVRTQGALVAKLLGVRA
jgi:DNA-binding CsgD family transcriptional regulator